MKDYSTIITEDVEIQPVYAAIYGPPGVGKTTLFSSFPKPLLIDIEVGSKNIQVKRLVPKTYDDVVSMLLWTIDQTQFESVGVDSVSRLEALIWQRVCSDRGWIDIEDPGYGKGYNVALHYWEKMFEIFDKIHAAGKHLVLIGHSEVKTINDPLKVDPYDKHQIRLQKSAFALLREKCSMVMYADKDQILHKSKGASKAKIVGEERVLYTSGGPGFDGKNRYDMPDRLPLDFGEFWAAYTAKSESAESLLKSIEELLPEVEESKRVAIKTYIKTISKDQKALKLALNRTRVLTTKGEKKDAV